MAQVKTLLIGCGGTGTNIVRRLVHAWSERYGWDQPVPPDIAVALIDAQADGAQGGNMPDQVYFSRTNHVNFPAEFAHYEDHLGWWPPGVTAAPGVRFNDGCGAIRSFGKFFSFLFAETVAETLRKSIGTITGYGMQQAGEEFQWQVWLVGSLGNGTGGGTFMDVATMARQILHDEGFMAPHVYGLFIPSSVTRRGHRGDDLMETQVAASGYAALIELQYEFNRLSSADWKPSTEYIALGVRNRESRDTSVVRFAAAAGTKASGAGAVAPFDFAFLLDRRGRNNLNKEYPDLLVTGAGVLDMLLEGADQDKRMLDLMIRCTDGRRFGSVGAVRLEAPALLLRDFAGNAQALHAIKIGSSADTNGWGELLGDRVPGGKTLPASDADTVDTSVEFFFREVLRARETGRGGAGSVNEFFDRFQESSGELEDRLRHVRVGLSRATEHHAITKLGSELQDLLDNESGDLRTAWKKEWLEGAASHWAATPGDARYDDLDTLGPKAGLRWLIDQRVARFVDAGAYGLLEAWLLELEETIEANRTSIWEHEHTQNVGSRSVDTSEALSNRISDLKGKASSILSFLLTGQIRREAQLVGQSAEALLDFLLWEAKVEIIDDLYQRMKAHAAILREASTRARDRLGCASSRQHFHRAQQRAEKALELNMSEARTATGVGISFFVGGDEAMRQDLIGRLEQDGGASSHALLAGEAELHRKVFAACLGANVGAYGGTAPQTTYEGRDNETLERDLRLAIESRARSEAGRVVGQVCDVEELLKGEARTVVDRWYRESFLQRDGADRAAGAAARRLLHDRVGGQVVARIRDLEWDSDPDGSAKRAQDLYLAGRLHKLVSLAAPQWSIRRCTTHSKPFFNFNAELGAINEAVGWIGEQLSVDVQAQAIPGFPRTSIECVNLEVGARLTDLRTDPEIEEYRRTMNDGDEVSKGFSPHTTRDYEEAGRAFLALRRAEAEAEGVYRSDGRAVLALALWKHADRPDLFAWLEDRGSGNYALARDILNERTRANPSGRYARSWQAGTSGLFPKGISQVVATLDSDDQRDLRFALKDRLWRDLQSLNWPGEGEGGRRTWAQIAQDLELYAAQLAADGAKAAGDQADTLTRMAADVQGLIEDLVESQGRRVPAALSE